MMMTEEQRTALHNKLTEAIGQEESSTLMQQLPPMGWDKVATKDDIKASEMRGLDELRKTEGRLVTQIAESNTRIAESNTLIAASTARIDELTKGLSEVHLALARHMRWTITTVIGLALTFGVPSIIDLF